jgi:hypothetical protein
MDCELLLTSRGTYIIHSDRARGKNARLIHLENWIALNETRIIAHVAYNQFNQSHRQPTITDYFPTTDPAVEPPDNILIIPRFASLQLTNVPLTREPGGSAGDEPRAQASSLTQPLKLCPLVYGTPSR